MLRYLFAFSVFGFVLSKDYCYWNAPCPYLLYATRTPYDTIRGDIRDYPYLENCKPISIWSIHRHGNRNPGGDVTEGMKEVAKLKDEIISSYEAGKGQLCAQDIEEFRRWTWNETLEVSESFLTATGYEELYDIGKRIREKYPHLLNGPNDAYYFRPTLRQRTVTSSIAFVHGLTDTLNLNLTIDEAREEDSVIKPYENCERYQDVKKGQTLKDEVKDYFNTPEYKTVQERVQTRLGISTQLSSDDIFSLYGICGFYRTWSPKLQSPWCSVFSDEDLVILEYADDVRHYYKNGYGSWINAKLGGPALKDLYENFEAAVQGGGKNVVSYFTHDTMLDMMFSAMGLFKDDTPIRGAVRDDSRLWKTSFIAPFASNFIAVLNSCQESGAQSNRVQFFINEKVTELCPLEGCTWQQFQDKFQPYTSSNLDFCSVDYDVPVSESSNGKIVKTVIGIVLFLQSVVLLLR